LSTNCVFVGSLYQKETPTEIHKITSVNVHDLREIRNDLLLSMKFVTIYDCQ